jgi:hypothetical protein
MANNTELFRTTRKLLQKTSGQLNISQTTTGRMVILNETNQQKIKEAVKLLDKAAMLLYEVR